MHRGNGNARRLSKLERNVREVVVADMDLFKIS